MRPRRPRESGTSSTSTSASCRGATGAGSVAASRGDPDRDAVRGRGCRQRAAALLRLTGIALEPDVARDSAHSEVSFRAGARAAVHRFTFEVTAAVVSLPSPIRVRARQIPRPGEDRGEGPPERALALVCARALRQERVDGADAAVATGATASVGSRRRRAPPAGRSRPRRRRVDGSVAASAMSAGSTS